MLKLITTKNIAVLTVAVFATALFLGPIASSIGDNMASAHKSKKCDSKKYYDKHEKYCKKHDSKKHGKGGGNSASQGIGQSQSSSQNSQVVSGGDTTNSGNNFNFQSQQNSGNNALAQQ
jgi:hypothetical protein